MDICSDSEILNELRADPYYLPPSQLKRQSTGWYGSLNDYNHVKQAFGEYNSGGMIEWYDKKDEKQAQQQQQAQNGFGTPAFYKSLFTNSPLKIPEDNSASKPETIKISRSATTKENFVKDLWKDF